MEKRVEDSIVEQMREVRPEDLNGADSLFGGRLMEWIDEVAGIVGLRYAQNTVVTASVDNLRFIRGVYKHEIVILIGRVTYVGNSSMEVRVDTYVEGLDGMRYPVNRAYLTLVSVDENGKGKKVPRLIVDSLSEQAEWEAGKKRSELRKQRLKEGF